jgi:D-threonate/D-erythronate kinase
VTERSIFGLADDLTGALEIGAKFAEYGLSAVIVTDYSPLESYRHPVLIIDTETRHLTASEAGERTRQAALAALDFSPVLIYKKTDSTLRGNIVAELHAIQEVFSGPRMVYVPAYPELGRTVKNGELFVWGKRVHETEFAEDRWNPVRDSHIRSVLGDVPALILEGESNHDIEAAVHTIFAEPAPHFCAGPAALAGALARHLRSGFRTRLRLPQAQRCLVVNGSLHPASTRQMKLAEERGLFDDKWMSLTEPIEGSGVDRALQTGQCVRKMLDSAHFDALVVFGGDTAFGIHKSLGAGPFEPQGEIAPGVPISRSGGLWWITKAGAFGAPDILLTIRERLA